MVQFQHSNLTRNDVGRSQLLAACRGNRLRIAATTVEIPISGVAAPWYRVFQGPSLIYRLSIGHKCDPSQRRVCISFSPAAPASNNLMPYLDPGRPMEFKLWSASAGCSNVSLVLEIRCHILSERDLQTLFDTLILLDFLIIFTVPSFSVF